MGIEATDTAKEAVALLEGALIIGNHDTVTLFGAQQQSELSGYVRKVAVLLARQNDAMEKVLQAVSDKPRSGERTKGIRGLFRKRWAKDKASPSRAETVALVEDGITELKVQQAQIYRDMKALEFLEVVLGECVGSLSSCIKEGERVLAGGERVDELWFDRLERRIADLRLSRTVATQSKEQAAVLRESNLVLADRVSMAISSLATAYQGQVAVGEGVDLLRARLDAADSIRRDFQR